MDRFPSSYRSFRSGAISGAYPTLPFVNRERDVRDKRNPKFEVRNSGFEVPKTSNLRSSRFSRMSRESRTNNEIRFTGAENDADA